MNIRNVLEKDKENLEKICLATAAESFKKNEKEIENTLLLYNRYYFRTQKDNCFVLTNESDEAVGYVLCAPDYKEFRRGFHEKELKDIAALGFTKKIRALLETNFNRPFSKSYPAHLHIDILPEYQGGGNGTRLINTLLCHLKGKGVKGVMLVAGADNKKAIAFYKKNGFDKIINFFGAYVMGIEIK